MEAAALGVFMISACNFATLFGRVLPDGFVRRVVMGAAMGPTAIGIIYSPWGEPARAPGSMTTGWNTENKVVVARNAKAGHLYVSGPGGLWIISPAGQHLGAIVAPRHIHNIARGDAGGKTLYLWARDRLYRMRSNIAGLRP